MKTLALSLGLALFSLACKKGPLEPERLPLDRFNCSRCGMLISELDDAAQWVGRGADPRFYDDLGCAAADASGVPAGGKFFVRADGGKRWLAAEDAFFARTTNARTPMGYGFFAFGRESDARARDAQGRTLRWSDFLRRVGEKRPGEVR